MADLIRLDPAQIQAMHMMNITPTAATRVVWFLEGMLHHHGGALLMAHDALAKSGNLTIRRLARAIDQRDPAPGDHPAAQDAPARWLEEAE